MKRNLPLQNVKSGLAYQELILWNDADVDLEKAYGVLYEKNIWNFQSIGLSKTQFPVKSQLFSFEREISLQSIQQVSLFNTFDLSN